MKPPSMKKLISKLPLCLFFSFISHMCFGQSETIVFENQYQNVFSPYGSSHESEVNITNNSSEEIQIEISISNANISNQDFTATHYVCVGQTCYAPSPSYFFTITLDVGSDIIINGFLNNLSENSFRTINYQIQILGTNEYYFSEVAYTNEYDSNPENITYLN